MNKGTIIYDNFLKCTPINLSFVPTHLIILYTNFSTAVLLVFTRLITKVEQKRNKED